MENNSVLLHTIAGNTEQILKRVDRIDEHVLRLQKEKLDVHECDKILSESAKVKADLNDRLRVVERAIYILFGAYLVVNIGIGIYLKLKS